MMTATDKKTTGIKSDLREAIDATCEAILDAVEEMSKDDSEPEAPPSAPTATETQPKTRTIKARVLRKSWKDRCPDTHGKCACGASVFHGDADAAWTLRSDKTIACPACA